MDASNSSRRGRTVAMLFCCACSMLSATAHADSRSRVQKFGELSVLNQSSQQQQQQKAQKKARTADDTCTARNTGQQSDRTSSANQPKCDAR
jgi:hypothetical protein